MQKDWNKFFRESGFKLIAGVDEAGRGPLAGPVVAAAVVLPAEYTLDGLNDSKQVSEENRKRLAEEIKKIALAYAVSEASVKEIDDMNILQATRLASQRAVKALQIIPDIIATDALTLNINEVPQVAIVKGDMRVPAISAASILAKTYRDALMCKLAKKHPQYGFEQHMGYATELHYFALSVHGPSKCHRKSFNLEK